MIRIVDIFLSSFGLLVFSPLICFVYFILYAESRSPIFYQERLGRRMKSFLLVKFRTMNIGTGNYATHLVDPRNISMLGKLLRKSKIDELPQLWNVLKGDMSMVGPRPCLISQQELIQARLKFNIFRVKPGITGLAQISGIDMSDPLLLAKTEKKMLRNFNILSYFYYIFLTVIGFGLGDRIKE
jgi:lipopolysaccharide/colanic/teichoic acid biosynthesis glycosyltransferase